jgi:hypothetical protein
MGQPPMRCSWNDTSEILVVVASPMQKTIGRVAGGRRRREQQLMLDGGKNLLRCQSLALEADLYELIDRFNIACDGRLVIPSEYLEAVVTKQG